MGLLDRAREVMKIEAEEILRVAGSLGTEFEEAVRLILSCKSKVVVTGMGKPGAIARKVAATLNSTGTPALYLHPAEGVHGDLGAVTRGDVVLVFSHSGETEEISDLIGPLRKTGCPIVAITGQERSTLGKAADAVITVSVVREACPLGLAPTSSTAAMLAVGDALAMCLMQEKRFTKEDFARFHPGGTLGRRLLLKVQDIMHDNQACPPVRDTQTVQDALLAMTSNELRGVVNVVDQEGNLLGLVTDGAVRRLLASGLDVLRKPLTEVMTPNPGTIGPDQPAGAALRILQDRQWDNLPVVDSSGKALGVVDVQDLLRAGVV